jgi:hypothetical protein
VSAKQFLGVSELVVEAQNAAWNGQTEGDRVAVEVTEKIVALLDESLPEVECPSCGTTIRARMADTGEVARIRELESQVADLQTKLTAARRQHRSDVVAQQERDHGRWAL